VFWAVVMLVGAAALVFLGAAYFVGRSERRAVLDAVVEQVKTVAERRPNQRVVDLHWKHGRVVRRVWIAWDRYPAVIGGKTLIGRYRPSSVVWATKPD
jgi:hypothetical protein